MSCPQSCENLYESNKTPSCQDFKRKVRESLENQLEQKQKVLQYKQNYVPRKHNIDLTDRYNPIRINYMQAKLSTANQSPASYLISRKNSINDKKNNYICHRRKNTYLGDSRPLYQQELSKTLAYKQNEDEKIKVLINTPKFEPENYKTPERKQKKVNPVDNSPTTIQTYSYLKKIQQKFVIDIEKSKNLNYFKSDGRKQTIDLLYQISKKYHFQQNTFFTAVLIFNQYLSKCQHTIHYTKQENFSQKLANRENIYKEATFLPIGKKAFRNFEADRAEVKPFGNYMANKKLKKPERFEKNMENVDQSFGDVCKGVVEICNEAYANDYNIAIACLYLAYKFDDIQKEWLDFQVLSQNLSVNKSDLKICEQRILQVLQFDIQQAPIMSFINMKLRNYLTDDKQIMKELQTLLECLATICQYSEEILKFDCTTLAQACVHLAQQLYFQNSKEQEINGKKEKICYGLVKNQWNRFIQTKKEDNYYQNLQNSYLDLLIKQKYIQKDALELKTKIQRII